MRFSQIKDTSTKCLVIGRLGNWEALKAGEKFAVMLDVGKRHGKGTAVRQLKWDSAILDVFREFMKGMKTKEEEA